MSNEKPNRGLREVPRTRVTSDEYRDNYERIFRSRRKKDSTRREAAGNKEGEGRGGRKIRPKERGSRADMEKRAIWESQRETEGL